MSTVRRSVEQTISRLVLRTLRERASLAGTPAARADAPLALATLIDQTLAHPVDAATLAAFCARAVEHGFGCVVVPLVHVAACADLLGGSSVRVGVALDSADSLESALAAGAGEIELEPPAELLHAEDRLGAWLAWLGDRCVAAGAVGKLNLLRADLAAAELLRICASAATCQLGLVVLPEAIVTEGQRALQSTIGIKVANIVTLEAARQALAAGAARLGTANGTELIEAAR